MLSTSSQQHSYDLNDIRRLRQRMYELKATPTRPQSSTSYANPKLKQRTRALLQYSQIRKPLRPSVDGPFNMLSHSDKTFTVLLNGKEEIVSIYCPKDFSSLCELPPLSKLQLLRHLR